MFIQNKYTKWYYDIIRNAKTRKCTGYAEKHHIIPKCMNGTDELENLVELTAREHFICHRLLTKMTTGYTKRKMLWAVGRFVQIDGNVKRDMTSKQYEIARHAISEARTGTKHSEDAKKKMSEKAIGRTPWNKGKTGMQSMSDKGKKALSELYTGTTKSDKTKYRMSESKKGHKAGMTGKSHSDETRQKMRESSMGKKGPHKREHCPYCDTPEQSPRHIKYCKIKQEK